MVAFKRNKDTGDTYLEYVPIFTVIISLKLHIQHVQEYPPQGNSVDVEDSQLWVPESSPVVEWSEQEEHEELSPRGYIEQSATKRNAILVEDTPVSSRQPSAIVVLYHIHVHCANGEKDPNLVLTARFRCIN